MILAESAGNYVRLHLDRESFLVRGRMSDILEKLGPDFLRVHRSFAAKLSAVDTVRRTGGADPLLILKNGQEVPVGRKYWSALKQHFA